MQKVVVLTGLFAATYSDGYITGQISSMVAAQQAGDLPLTDSQISWIASSLHVTSVLGFALAAIVTEKFGRRRTITMMTTPVILYWIITYFTHEPNIFITSRIILGVFFGSIMSLCVLTIGEYTSPNTRGIWVQIIFSFGALLGIMSSHILGVLVHWRTVAVLGVIPAGLSAILPFFWVESPTWLASKGRFEECQIAFRQLHGTGVEVEKELRLLIELEKSKQDKLPEFKSVKAALKKIFSSLKYKYFWKISFLACVLHVYRVAIGSLMLITYMITVFKDVSGDSSVLVPVFAIDGCMVFGLLLSCVLRKILKTRTLLFSCGSMGVVLLIILSAFLYFQPDTTYSQWITCVLLALYIIVINSGPGPILESLFGEIFPLEIKTYCLFGFGVFGGGLLFLQLFSALRMIKLLEYYGVLLLLGVLSTLCLTLLWVYLPETMGRTLQEIELYFKNNKFDNIDVLLNEERTKFVQ